MLASVLQSFASLSDVLTNFTFPNFLDIFVVTLILYFILLFIKQTHSYIILNAILGLAALFYLSTVLDLALIRQFFQPLLTFIIVILVVVFQGELRRFVRWISAPTKFHFSKILSMPLESLDSILSAVEFMSQKKIGALIVFQGEQSVEDLLNGGFAADARISTHLLLSIFDSHTPGHDGAVIISRNRIRKFGVHLPLAENYGDYKKSGLRHRAGVGISGQSDVLAVIVSEERGTISVSENGIIKTVEDVRELRKELLDFYKENEADELTWKNFWNHIVVKNFWTKLLSFSIASFLWFFLIFQSGIVTQEIKVPIEVKFLPKELTVGEIAIKSVDVTIDGAQKDLENFDPKSSKLTINAQDFQEGLNKVTITKEMFNFPTYLTVKEFTPDSIKITVTKVVPVTPPTDDTQTTDVKNP
jgi:diadenylate cyclase